MQFRYYCNWSFNRQCKIPLETFTLIQGVRLHIHFTSKTWDDFTCLICTSQKWSPLVCGGHTFRKAFQQHSPNVFFRDITGDWIKQQCCLPDNSTAHLEQDPVIHPSLQPLGGIPLLTHTDLCHFFIPCLQQALSASHIHHSFLLALYLPILTTLFHFLTEKKTYK